MTSRDAHPASRLTNRCIIAGLLSVGVNVQTCARCRCRCRATPFATRAMRAFTRGISPHDPDRVLVEFFDSHGVNVDKNTERKIENIFFREDFRRTPMEAVGMLDFPERTLEAYTSGFLEALAPQAISDANLRVVIDYAFGNASLILPRILSNLGVEMIALNAFFDNTKVLTFARESRTASRAARRTSRRRSRANLGILLDQHGEAFVARRRSRPHHRRAAVVRAADAAVAAQRSGRADRRAGDGAGGDRDASPRQYGATVVRTRSDRRSLMALASARRPRLAFAGGANYELIFPEFQPVFDSLYAAAKIMELIAAQGAPAQRDSSTSFPPGISRRAAITARGIARARSCAGCSTKPTARTSS